jgi:protein tyrosine/serine phosphatase
MNIRQSSKRLFNAVTCTSLMLLLVAGTLASSGSGPKRDASGTARVDIENFGQVNDHLFRGSQPKGDNYRQLATIGIKTVIDLRSDFEASSKGDAERAGLQYINLPLEPKESPTAESAAKFLELVKNEANWPVYVHCAGGRHRTGSMVAVYRMEADHWTIDQAYDEMKQYDFYTRLGHACFKDFVFDYYRSIQQRLQANNTAPPAQK